jgi:hypothetical protein
MSHTHRSVRRRLVALPAIVGLAAGCLDRPVAPAEPHTTNIFVDVVTQTFVDKIDLLFMIDNSRSMADKQAILRDAVPVLVQRLVTPSCLDAGGNTVGTADPNGVCATGDPEFIPIKDIHIGVITSSLGNHGGEECSPTANDAAMGRTPDDRAELLPFVRPTTPLTSWNGSGFLAWDPGQDKNVPPGEANLGALVDNVRAQVVASGEIGCGYESSLEAWYRFLVDPEPPASMGVVDNQNVKGPVNEALIRQREAFLRPDSLLAIVMLTDENDCSIDDENGHQGFLVSSTGRRLPRASSACASDPNDRCCHSCALAAPEGCTPNEMDAECSKKTASQQFAELTLPEDMSNVRCFDHRRRFGLDLLYPTQRYIDALTKPTVKNRAGVDVPNPIFRAPPGGSPRPETNVLLAGIVGVPWQDIATDATRSGEGLEYLDAAALAATGRWDLILGNPKTNEPPDDAHMIESIVPRTGSNPLLGVPIAPATSQDPEENPINGHEQNVPGFDDLQYACTFELTTPRTCTTDGPPCDCYATDQANNRPLCDYPNGPDTPGIQHHAKAYPGLRHLEVLKGVGNNGIVASICPKYTEPAAGLRPEADPSYGYNPAVQSILEVFGTRLGGQCLPRKLAPDADPSSATFGQVPCRVIEAIQMSEGGECFCDASKGRTPVDSADLERSVRQELSAHDKCGGDTGVSCSAYCQCEVAQLEGTALAECQAGSKNPNIYGYCYVDADQGIGDPALVERCDPTEKRLLRWVGEGLPANGSTMMMACFGAAL